MAESANSIHNSGQKKLAGKVAIITGGASGIGEETARLFAHHGARMVVIEFADSAILYYLLSNVRLYG